MTGSSWPCKSGGVAPLTIKAAPCSEWSVINSVSTVPWLYRTLSLHRFSLQWRPDSCLSKPAFVSRCVPSRRLQQTMPQSVCSVSSPLPNALLSVQSLVIWGATQDKAPVSHPVRPAGPHSSASLTSQICPCLCASTPPKPSILPKGYCESLLQGSCLRWALISCGRVRLFFFVSDRSCLSRRLFIKRQIVQDTYYNEYVFVIYSNQKWK